MKNVDQNIKQLRLERGWNQKIVAERLGISIPAYSKIESGITDINLSRLVQLASLFDVSVAEVLFGSAEINNKVDKKELTACEYELAVKEKEVFNLQKKVIELFDELRNTH
ncbi:helix-turn-helix domain-containing protein [Pedobacter sp. SAFR-022]|uniref:helix-turn-helix domain-containing protein n=1 Tax=Pedobacter sp. SAFR-022 TaxID=3436861 RepID=UPI003F7FF545